MTQSDEPQGFTAEEQALFEKLNIGKEGGVPLPSFIKPSEVVEQARPLAKSIFDSWEPLNRIVGQHEERLYERWKGLKKKRRREMLLEAWGEMPPSHRPDLEIWKAHEQNGTTTWTEEERKLFMWPAINLEDLCKTRPLWLMIKARGRSSPDVFAASDLDTTRFGKSCLALMPRYLNQYSMLFTGRTNAETYGQLYAWDDLPSEDNAVFEKRGTHPGEGLWILIIQARLYAFLKDMAIKILGLSDGVGDDAAPATKPELDNSFRNADEEFTEFPVAVFEAQYSRPPQIVLQRLLDYTYSKLWEAEDHLWALREDPAYFTSTLNAWREHRRELVPDTEGSAHPVLATPEVLWSRVINACIRRALEQIESWNILYSKVHLVVQQMEKHGAAITPAAPLPREVSLAIYSLYHHLQNFENEPMGNLQMGAFASPPLRPYFRIRPARDSADTSITLTTGPEAPSDGAVADLIWVLGKLQDPPSRALVGMPTLLDAIEHSLAASPTARTALTPWLASQLSATAVFTRCLAELDAFHPHAARFGVEMQDKDTAEVLGMDFHMTMQRLRPLLEHEFGGKVVSLGVPDGGRFEYDLYDVGGRAAAERALDGFWTRVLGSLERGRGMTVRVKEVLGRMVVQRAAAGGGSGRGKSGGGGTVRVGSRKKKVVDKRAMRVFRALFHDPTVEAARSSMPAEVQWLDLVHAMHVSGCEVIKMYGSAWLFVSKGKDAQGRRPIMLEEPWASTKLSACEARWIGKRLARSCGWNKDTFEAE